MIDPGVQYTTFLGGNASRTATASPSTRPATHRRRHHPVARLPDHDRRVPPHRLGAELLRRVRHEAQRRRHRARLLDVRRRQQHGLRQQAGRRRGRQRLRHRARRSRRTSRPPPARSIARSTSHRTARGARTDNTDGFVFKLNAAGSALELFDLPRRHRHRRRRAASPSTAPATPTSTGETLSRDFPTTAGAFRRTLRGEYDMFVTKLNPTGLGAGVLDVPGRHPGRQRRAGRGRRRRQRVRAGLSSSTDFPTTPGAFDTTANGGFDATADKAQSGRVGARLLDLHRRPATSTAAAASLVDGTGSAYVERRHVVGGLADHARRVRHDTSQRRRLRHEGEPGRLGDRCTRPSSAARTSTRSAASSSTRRATPGSRAARTRPTSRSRRTPRHHLQRRRRRGHRRAEPDRVGAAVRDLPRRLAGRGRRRHRPRSERRHLHHRLDLLAGLPGHGRRVRHGLERRPADLLGRRLRRRSSTSTRPARRRLRRRRAGGADAGVAGQRLVAAPADHVRLEQHAERGVVHDPDRRLERLQRAAGARARTSRLDLRHDWAAATTHFWRVRGVNSPASPARSRRPGASRRGRAAARGAGVRSTSTRPTVVGGNGSSGTVVMASGPPRTRRCRCRAATRPSPAFPPRSRCRPTASPAVRYLDLRGLGVDLGGDHRDLQRLEPLGDADGDARRGARRDACRAWRPARPAWRAVRPPRRS